MKAPRPEQERVAKLADAAEAFAKTYASPHHVYKALDQAGVIDPEERALLIPAIKSELHRRKPVPLSKRTDLIEDARRMEIMHPKDADKDSN